MPSRPMNRPETITAPLDAVAAATHAAPYAYYARLIAERPIARDPRLGLWVAASASAVEAVLADPKCRVRPLAEPVPAAIVGTAAGELFRRLVRMTDGGSHCPMKGAMHAAIDTIDRQAAARRAQETASALCVRLAPSADPGAITALSFRLPVHVVAGLLGIPAHCHDRMTDWIDAFVRSISPVANGATVEAGADAARAMMDVFESAVIDGWAGGLLANFAGNAARAGIRDAGLVAANAVGLMMQSYEATAGLIGNTLLAIAAQGMDAGRLRADPASLRDVVQEVLRHDPPIQNTRRFVAEAGVVAGEPMEPGDAILVVLAAANRDPAVNPSPHAFDPARRSPRRFTLGHGAHACPGGDLSETIAGAGIATLLAWSVNIGHLAGSFAYRPSPNARIPIWG